MARLHVYLTPDDYDYHRKGEEVTGFLIHNDGQTLIHLDIDDREVIDVAYPLVTIQRRI